MQERAGLLIPSELFPWITTNSEQLSSGYCIDVKSGPTTFDSMLSDLIMTISVMSEWD